MTVILVSIHNSYCHIKFSILAEGEVARQCSYAEFPSRFVWKRSDKKWTLRRNTSCPAIGRMYYVSPIAGERFYLRTLLSVVRGPKSFEDLRTYSGITHTSFRDACAARGLLEDDGEWRTCLRDAIVWKSGHRLRLLFMILLLHCSPIRPESLWHEFRPQICDDLEHRLHHLGFQHPTEDDIYDFGLFLLDQLLRENGHSLTDFPTMPRHRGGWERVQINNLITEQLNYSPVDEAHLLQENSIRLNEEQRLAYETIVNSIEHQDGQIFFLSGPAGTGKTFVYRTICHKVRSEGWIVLCVASSGVAALLLPGGRTSHMRFKIPVGNLSETSTCSISHNSALADLIRHTRAVIWDEVPMQNRFGPEAVDRTFRDVRNDERPFGGITVIFGGDFQQTLPVIPHGSREEIVGASLRRSPLWPNICVLHLRQNMRLLGSEDADLFARWLLSIARGEDIDENGQVPLPQDLTCLSLEEMVSFVYTPTDIASNRPIPLPHYFLDRSILSARNEDASELNVSILARFPGEATTYLSADSIEHHDTSRPQPPKRR